MSHLKGTDDDCCQAMIGDATINPNHTTSIPLFAPICETKMNNERHNPARAVVAHRSTIVASERVKSTSLSPENKHAIPMQFHLDKIGKGKLKERSKSRWSVHRYPAIDPVQDGHCSIHMTGVFLSCTTLWVTFKQIVLLGQLHCVGTG